MKRQAYSICEPITTILIQDRLPMNTESVLFVKRFRIVAFGFAFAAGLMVLLTNAPVQAVIINSTDGTGNTTANTTYMGDYWANVGTVNGSSCVYLGSGWVVTASHVGSGATTLNGVAYAYDTSTVTRLHDPANSSQVADLVMYKLKTTPTGLNDLPIYTGSLAANASVTGIGYGRDRATSKTYWQVTSTTSGTTTTYNWTETTGRHDASGYKWASTRTKRWGTNNVVSASPVAVTTSGTTSCYYTSFDEGSSIYEMQAAQFDSGGGILYKSGNTWELAGVILAIKSFSGQPSNTAVYENQTYFADLALYSSQISSIMTTAIPEPSALAMLTTGGLFAVFFWSRKRSR
jgi:hypothetical protein